MAKEYLRFLSHAVGWPQGLPLTALAYESLTHEEQWLHYVVHVIYGQFPLVGRAV